MASTERKRSLSAANSSASDDLKNSGIAAVRKAADLFRSAVTKMQRILGDNFLDIVDFANDLNESSSSEAQGGTLLDAPLLAELKLFRAKVNGLQEALGCETHVKYALLSGELHPAVLASYKDYAEYTEGSKLETLLAFSSPSRQKSVEMETNINDCKVAYRKLHSQGNAVREAYRAANVRVKGRPSPPHRQGKYDEQFIGLWANSEGSVESEAIWFHGGSEHRLIDIAGSESKDHSVLSYMLGIAMTPAESEIESAPGGGWYSAPSGPLASHMEGENPFRDTVHDLESDLGKCLMTLASDFRGVDIQSLSQQKLCDTDGWLTDTSLRTPGICFSAETLFAASERSAYDFTIVLASEEVPANLMMYRPPHATSLAHRVTKFESRRRQHDEQSLDTASDGNESDAPKTEESYHKEWARWALNGASSMAKSAERVSYVVRAGSLTSNRCWTSKRTSRK